MSWRPSSSVMIIWLRMGLSHNTMGKLKFAASAVLLSIPTIAQQIPSGRTATDLFIGRWNLDIDKSSPGPTGGAITIEPEGKKYKITLKVSYPGKFGGTSWTVSDMKGWGSPVTRDFNQAIEEEWHVRREAADSFIITAVFRAAGAGGQIEWRYTVSPDGQTLTRRVVSGGPSDHRNQVFIFDKAP